MCNDLITQKLITQYPTMSDTTRNLISCIPHCKRVEDYFCWLNKQITLLKPKQRKQIINRIVSENDTQYHEAIAELVYIAFWNWLEWPFEKDPPINKKTPDFRVVYDKKVDKSFVCDVAVVRHNHPHKEKIINGNTLSVTVDGKPFNEGRLPLPKQPINQAHRVLMKIDGKIKKYCSILSNTPFLVCFFIYGYDNQFYIDKHQRGKALFGDLAGIFGCEKYKSLTAVIFCEQKFYQTSNIQKAKFDFSIYVNPLGEWENKENTPFSLLGFPLNGLIDKNTLEFCDPKEIEFY